VLYIRFWPTLQIRQFVPISTVMGRKMENSLSYSCWSLQCTYTNCVQQTCDFLTVRYISCFLCSWLCPANSHQPTSCCLLPLMAFVSLFSHARRVLKFSSGRSLSLSTILGCNLSFTRGRLRNNSRRTCSLQSSSLTPKK